MIDAKQLRIGNFVIMDMGIPEQVTADWFAAWGMGFDNVTENTFIPLTPEIMLKIGFERKEPRFGYWDHYVLKNGWHISEWIHDGQSAGFEEKGVFYWGDDYVGIKFLHQLQNLYFILTGTELEIKL